MLLRHSDSSSSKHDVHGVPVLTLSSKNPKSFIKANVFYIFKNTGNIERRCCRLWLFSETLHRNSEANSWAAVTLIISVPVGQFFLSVKLSVERACCEYGMTACSIIEVSALVALVRWRMVPSTQSPLPSFCLQESSMMWPLMAGGPEQSTGFIRNGRSAADL